MEEEKESYPKFVKKKSRRKISEEAKEKFAPIISRISPIKTFIEGQKLEEVYS